MSLAGKIRKIQAGPHIRKLKEYLVQEHADCERRIAQIKHVEDLHDSLDAAIARADYSGAARIAEEIATEYAEVKNTSLEEALKLLNLVEIVLKSKDKNE